MPKIYKDDQDYANANANAGVTKQTPKLFHKDLTGSKGGRGFLDQNNSNWTTSTIQRDNHIRQEFLTGGLIHQPFNMYLQNQTDTYVILDKSSVIDVDHLDARNKTFIPFHKDDTVKYKMYFTMRIANIATTSKTKTTTFNMDFEHNDAVIIVNPDKQNVLKGTVALTSISSHNRNYVSGTMMEDLFNNTQAEFIYMLIEPKRDKKGITLQDEFTNYGIHQIFYELNDVVGRSAKEMIDDIEIYDLIEEEANRITFDLEDLIVDQIKLSRKLHIQNKDSATVQALAQGILLLNYTNNILDLQPTNDMLLKIHQALYDLVTDGVLVSEIVEDLIASNLRLSLANNIHELDDLAKNKLLHQTNQPVQDVIDAFNKNDSFSFEQKQVITTNEPLSVVAAGAGTGKSHTLTGRLEYLKQCGEDLNKVLVLSFTKVAANNITNRYKGVQSLTLASLFNDMYTETFPKQELTSSQILANALKTIDVASINNSNPAASAAHYKKIVDQLIVALNKIEPKARFQNGNVADGTAMLSRIVRYNLNTVIELLNTAKASCFTIQPIIINTLLAKDPKQLSVPSNLQNINYLITDESQDISTIEYIVLLRMSIANKSQLMIIGDGSQTLYEFRNSNPRFLVDIQASGAFKNYSLSTNYRSHGTILAFANPLLKVIDANRQAKIQLMPNELNQIDPTDDEFNTHIKIHNTQKPSQKSNGTPFVDYETLNIIARWAGEKIGNGQNVAIISAKNSSIDDVAEPYTQAIESYLNRQIKTTRIKSQMNRSKTFISEVISNTDRDVIVSYTENSFDEFVTKMRDLFDARWEIISDKITQKGGTAFPMPGYAQSALNDLASSNTMRQMFSPKNEDFAQVVMDAFIQKESRHNNVVEMLKSNESNEIDIDNFDLIMTTDHSAKGLEFDNVILLYDSTDRRRGTQASLRMLYVALTRAKENELIINNDDLRGGKAIKNSLIGIFETPISSLYGIMRKRNVKPQDPTQTPTP